ncbi:MAG: DUF11 domain-containing protein [Pseudomonadales bacterium]|nr:DUF11 domain-containing protein [Pseudomonadales bacterium]
MSFKLNKNLARWVAAGFFATAGQMAFAASTETPADTDITNTATVSYSVSGVAQPDETGTRVFKVDNKVDLTVTGGTTNVVANATDQVITFTVTNTGNETQGYALDIEANGGDDFDANNVRIYVEDGTTPGFQIGEDTLYTAGSGVNIGDLDPFSGTGGDAINVYVVSDIPTSGGGTAPTDGQTAEYNLLATTLVAGSTTVQGQTAGADTFNAVDVVFADETGGSAGPHSSDAVEDGQASATGTYLVASAQLSVTKTSAVISDPVNGATNPKAIPGATVRYTITVSNAGGASASATGVTLVDSIPTNTTYTANTITLDAAAQTDIDDSGVPVDNSDFNVTNAGAVTVVIGTVAAGASNVVTFDVTID